MAGGVAVAGVRWVVGWMDQGQRAFDERRPRLKPAAYDDSVASIEKEVKIRLQPPVAVILPISQTRKNGETTRGNEWLSPSVTVD